MTGRQKYLTFEAWQTTSFDALKKQNFWKGSALITRFYMGKHFIMIKLIGLKGTLHHYVFAIFCFRA